MDDRNLRGTLEDTLAAHHIIVRFDEAAGHMTQHDKTAMLTNCNLLMEKIRSIELGGHKPKCGNAITLVGECIASGIARIVAPVDYRVQKAIDTARKIAAVTTSVARTARVAVATVIPTAVYGTVWVKATTKMQGRLKAKMLTLTWGKGKLMRCAEVVTAILGCPTDVDPTYASVRRAVLTTNRMLTRNAERADDFYKSMTHVMAGTTPTHATGPAAGVKQAAELIGADVKLHNGEVQLVTPLGAVIRLGHPNNSFVATAVRDAARHQILKDLATRANAQSRTRTDGTLAHGRADMAEIGDWVNLEATKKLINSRTCKDNGGIGWHKQTEGGDAIHKLNSRGKAYLKQIIAGSIRPPNRLKHLDIGVEARCGYCGHANCDAAHLFWECSGMAKEREEHLDYIQKIVKNATGQSIWRGNQLKACLQNNAFRHCGICPGEKAGIAAANALHEAG